MKKRATKVISVILAVIAVVGCMAGCGGKKDKDASDAGFKVAIVCSGSGQNDNGYNASACKTIAKISDELNCEYKIIEPVNGVPEALETLGGDGYDLVFSLEYDFDALIKGVGGADPIAAQYPNTTYVIFNDDPNRDENGDVIHDNVISVLFDVNESSYLAGYASVLINENMEKLFGEEYKLTPLDEGRGIGFVGGTNSNGILVYSAAFVEGANAAAQEYDATYDYYAKYDAGFTDSALGGTVAETFYNEGVNIVFADAGVVGDGITAKAKELGKIAIQTDANLDDQQPGHVLTSVLKITGVPVEAITKAYAEGKINELDRLQRYNLETGATEITDMSVIGKYVEDETAWAEIIEKVDNVRNQIINGEIDITNKQIGEEFDPSTCPNIVIKSE